MTLQICPRCNGSGHDGRCDKCGGSGFVEEWARKSRLEPPLNLSPIQRPAKKQPPTARKNSRLSVKAGAGAGRQKRFQEPKSDVDPMPQGKGRGKRRLRVFPHPSIVKAPRPELVPTGKWRRVPAADVIKEESGRTPASRLQEQRRSTTGNGVTAEKAKISARGTIQENRSHKAQRKRETLPPNQAASDRAAAGKTAFEMAFEKAQHDKDGSKHWGCFRDANGQFGSFPAFDPCEDVDE